MNHPKSSLSKLAAVASVLGLVACGSHNQSQANTPSSAQNTTSTTQPYGTPMGQSGTAESAPSGSATTPSTAAGGNSSGSQGMVGQGTSQDSTSGSTDTGNAPRSTMGTADSSGSSTSPYGTTGSTGATNAMGGSMDVSNLSDAQFAGVLQTINQGRIQEAQLGQSKASSPEVKRFAREMVTSHRTAQNKESALFSRLQITPTDSTVSDQLKADTQSDISSLQSMRGKEFDRSFIDSQVRYLNNSLELIDRMTPDVKSSDLKAELQKVRTKVDAHLQDAERVQANLDQAK